MTFSTKITLVALFFGILAMMTGLVSYVALTAKPVSTPLVVLNLQGLSQSALGTLDRKARFPRVRRLTLRGTRLTCTVGGENAREPLDLLLNGLTPDTSAIAGLSRPRTRLEDDALPGGLVEISQVVDGNVTWGGSKDPLRIRPVTFQASLLRTDPLQLYSDAGEEIRNSGVLLRDGQRWETLWFLRMFGLAEEAVRQLSPRAVFLDSGMPGEIGYALDTDSPTEADYGRGFQFNAHVWLVETLEKRFTRLLAETQPEAVVLILLSPPVQGKRIVDITLYGQVFLDSQTLDVSGYLDVLGETLLLPARIDPRLSALSEKARELAGLVYNPYYLSKLPQ